MLKDPICGMTVDKNSSYKAAKNGQEYYFCSSRCRDAFIKQEGITDAPTCSHCAPGRKPLLKNKLFIISAAAVLLVGASFLFPFLLPFRIAFLAYLRKIWWAVLLGLFLGGVIEYYIPKEYISKILARKSPATIFNAVFLGFLMSACSHGILALSIQLHKKGASNPSVVSFLLASPWANIAVTVMLISLFGLKGIFIVLAALVVAVNTGFIFMFLENKGLIEKNTNSVEVKEGFSIIKDMKIRMSAYRFSLASAIADTKGILEGAASLADMILWWVIIGVLIASIAGAYIPVHLFHKFMGPSFFGLTATLLVATIIEVCSEGSSPLAFEIYKQTGALGNSFVFLMAGVVTDYTEIGLLWANVGKRTALWLPLVTVPQVVAIGFLLNTFLLH
jgi:uncharacterized membrane protein YraQ (UPF0718 family)/YHS domain-containing protein